MTIVLTTCTNRKRGAVFPELNSDNLTPGPINSVFKQWVKRLKIDPAIYSAREIYCGRGFREAEASAKYLDCPLYIVSAGLGIINSDDPIPVYNLSAVSGTPNSILRKITGDSSAKAWWSKISKRNPFGSSLKEILENHPDQLILLALSRAYIELLYDEIMLCTASQQINLRFFGKQLDSALPQSLSQNWMPYDDRLDSSNGNYSGTQSDFAQRSLRHFVAEVLDKCKDGDTNTHHSMVLKSLAPLESRETPKRQRLSDQDICKVILNNWDNGKGQSSALLRIIRHDLGIACEQSRFQGLYHAMKHTMKGTK